MPNLKYMGVGTFSETTGMSHESTAYHIYATLKKSSVGLG